jgi:uncharacterized membrane protein
MSRAFPAGPLALTAALAGVILLLAPGSPLARAFGTALVMFLPGLALGGALLAPRTNLHLRATLAVAASWALTILCALVLNVTPLGVDAAAIGVVLAVVALAGALLQYVKGAAWATAPLPTLPLWTIAAIGAAAFVMTGAFLASTAALDSNRSTFTQLWLVPSGDGGARVGVFNGERFAETYTVEVTAGTARESYQLTLEHAATWEIALSVPATAQTVRADVFRADAPGVVYRTAMLRLASGR